MAVEFVACTGGQRRVTALALAIAACCALTITASTAGNTLAAAVPSTTQVIPVVAQPHNTPLNVPHQPVEPLSMENVVVTDKATPAEDLNSPLVELEEQLEEIGSVVSSVSSAALPLLGAALAVFSGLFLRHKMSGNGANEEARRLRPMEMEASEVPLARRGALATLGLLPMAAVSPAFAAKSSGRVGGSNFRSFKSAPAPPAGAAVSGGAIGGAAAGPTVVYAQPPVVVASPPVVVAPASPFGFGPFGFGLSTGEFLALNAIELGQAFVREQQRQEFLRQQLETQRKLGRDEAQIEALQQQLAAQEQRMRDLEQAMNQKGVAAPAQ